MPKIKERNQTEKVKGKKKGGKPAQTATRRVMTAELKKELAQRKQGGNCPAAEIPRDNFIDITSSTTGSASADSGAGAVEQVEQTAQAAAVDAGRFAKRGASLAASKAKRKRREIKERHRQPDTQGQPLDTPTPNPGVHGSDTPPASDARRGRTADGTTTPPPPTPEDRMRQRAVNQRKERLTRPRAGTPPQGEAPASPHYGGPAPAPGPSTKNPPAGARSIHPSIKERPRRSTLLKEKPQAGAIRPKTRQAVEQAARTRAAPASTPSLAGKKAAAGFLDWVLKNVGLPSDGHWYIGRNLTAVSTANAKPGDFALYPDSSHIGVVVGRNEAGTLLIYHCASGQNNIVITEFSASGFTAVGKLSFMD